MTPFVSFYLTTHNEGKYVRDLIEQLVPVCKETGDEIIVLDDYSQDEITLDALTWGLTQGMVTLINHRLNSDFAGHKNHGHQFCKGKYIFQIDADEKLSPTLLVNLHEILKANEVDMYAVPRINMVNGLTTEDIQRWRWNVNEKGHVQWPDYQTRLYRNHPNIRWVGKVHEQITGFKSFAPLPAEEEYAIIHIKDIDRQRKQNELYRTIER